jgi:pimeloyl-ACP methyl ester carboxylesterase
MPKPTIVLVHGAWADGASSNAVSSAARAPRSTSRTRTPFSTSSVTPELRKGTPRRFSSHRPCTSPSRKTSLKRTGGLIVASQRPITLGANTAPTQATAWKTIPSWTVIGTEDRVIPPATQRRMAERAGSTITEVAGSHVSMVSHPRAAIDAILAAVAFIGG